jgi:hypothetical protein
MTAREVASSETLQSTIRRGDSLLSKTARNFLNLPSRSLEKSTVRRLIMHYYCELGGFGLKTLFMNCSNACRFSLSLISLAYTVSNLLGNSGSSDFASSSNRQLNRNRCMLHDDAKCFANVCEKKPFASVIISNSFLRTIQSQHPLALSPINRFFPAPVPILRV